MRSLGERRQLGHSKYFFNLCWTTKAFVLSCMVNNRLASFPELHLATAGQQGPDGMFRIHPFHCYHGNDIAGALRVRLKPLNLLRGTVWASLPVPSPLTTDIRLWVWVNTSIQAKLPLSLNPISLKIFLFLFRGHKLWSRAS